MTVIDARGLKCPMPVLLLRRALCESGAYGTILLISDDPVAPIDIPHFCRTAGITLLSEVIGVTDSRFEVARTQSSI